MAVRESAQQVKADTSIRPSFIEARKIASADSEGWSVLGSLTTANQVAGSPGATPRN